jgi:hypothetical protein
MNEVEVTVLVKTGERISERYGVIKINANENNI